MAKGETDKSPPATSATTATRNQSEAERQADREKLENALAARAGEYLALFNSLQLVPGGVTLFSLGISFEDVDEIRYPQFSDAQLADLLTRAETDSDAYQGAIYIARLMMARRIQLPGPLLSFVLDALNGHVVRPKGGRKRARDTHLRAFMYAWALLLNQRAPDIPLVRIENKKQGWDDWSTCDLVARAFSKAGKYTTFQQVKSYCYDESFWHVRAVASLMWQQSKRYEDTGRDFVFDMSEFRFGKP